MTGAANWTWLIRGRVPTLIDEPASLVRAYLEHRREREAQILDALCRGATTVDGIVAGIYGGLARHLRERAARP